MSGARRLRILASLTSDPPSGEGSQRLCQVSAEVTEMTGAGIMLMSGDVPRGSVCTTDEVSTLIEQLQDALGEGPCVDAFTRDRPVLEPDLRDPELPRWPAFSGPALDAGVRAVFGFPLRVGAVRLGALNLYRAKPGPLSDDQHADALVMADVVAESILLMQSQAPPGQLAGELEAGADFQYVVHQAAGMVAVQLGISVAKALLRLRAHAFGNDVPLVFVARSVVGRTLRFEPGDEDQGPARKAEDDD
jgi:GAF domain-containing protein